MKPNFRDSNFGITQDSVVTTPEALIARVDEMRAEFPGLTLLVQKYLTGNKYSVGTIGNPSQGLHFMPMLEVDYRGLDAELPKIPDYETKFADSDNPQKQMHVIKPVARGVEVFIYGSFEMIVNDVRPTAAITNRSDILTPRRQQPFQFSGQALSACCEVLCE